MDDFLFIESIMSDQKQQEQWQQQHDTRRESRDSDYDIASSAGAIRDDPRDPFAGGPYIGNAGQRRGRRFNGRNAHRQWCEHCDVAIENRAQYWHHKRAHMDPGRLIACPSCDFVTCYISLLEKHMACHSAVKPLTCSRCDYTCANKSMLKSHSRVHADAYPYRCDACPFRSKYKNSWQTHLRSKKHYLTTKHTATRGRQHDRPADDVASAAAPVPLRNTDPADRSWASSAVLARAPARREGVASELRRHRRPVIGTDGETKRLSCDHCDVEFAGIVMYVKHMGSPCSGQSLKCNLCGEVVNDTPSSLSHASRVPAHGQVEH